MCGNMQRFTNFLDSGGVQYAIVGNEQNPAVSIVQRLQKTGVVMEFTVIFVNESIVEMVAFGIASSFPEYARDPVLRELNKLNSSMRLVKFALNENNEICVIMTFINFSEENIDPKQIFLMLRILLEQIEKIQPDILKMRHNY